MSLCIQRKDQPLRTTRGPHRYLRNPPMFRPPIQIHPPIAPGSSLQMRESLRPRSKSSLQDRNQTTDQQQKSKINEYSLPPQIITI